MLILFAILGLACAFAPAAHANSSGSAERTNPIVKPVAADPSIVRGPDGMYYLFSTSDDWRDGRGLRLLPIFKSFDLTNWMYAGTVFDRPPAWQSGNRGLWAPDIHYVNGQYRLYYSLGGGDNPCIGLATAASPTGPWTDLGRAVFCANDIGIKGTIDPFLWADSAGQSLFVGNFHGVYAVPLDVAGSVPAGRPVRVADNRFEAAYVEQHDGYYYLFVSAGDCCTGASSAYRVLVGRSTSITGPYVDRAGRNLNEGGGDVILAGNQAWVGPGHNAVVADDAGTDWLVYHATPRDNLSLPGGLQRREGMIDRIVWANGWPQIGNGSPSSAGSELPEVRLPVRVSMRDASANALPAQGGVISATLRVQAFADRGFTGQVWVEVTKPDGGRFGPIFGPVQVNLQPGAVFEVPVSYTVAQQDAGGMYDMVGYAGGFPLQPVEFGTTTVLKSAP
ncbi:family 43 glycosylhydrolase [Aldersonia kunmingensis]|uniref:family 43 glycosylhydrolase n=1 Tax=Aldersonia kunmingensis TaxID=408066 RepID=UPI001470EF13|nr:family 43 glycosylhydrolase [Aldersonia kunmingensis]